MWIGSIFIMFIYCTTFKNKRKKMKLSNNDIAENSSQFSYT